jgi:hypothetical protein
MSTINTDLRTAITDKNITIELEYGKAFNDVFGLGLVLNSKDPASGRFATDATGLHDVKEHLEYVQNNCLWGLAGIAALVTSANPADLCKTDMDSIGSVIGHLVRLAEEATGHLASINSDINKRAGLITDPEQAAYHAKVHQDAVEIRKSRSMDYPDAVLLAAGSLAAGQAKEPRKGEE